MLILLQSPQIDVVRISIVSGDGWLKASTQRALRMLELTGHGHVPVAAGTLYPLINSREETELWEEMYGEFAYKGIWNEPRPNGWQRCNGPGLGPFLQTVCQPDEALIDSESPS